MPKMILLDLKMPKVDGVDVLRELKGTESTQSIPVVIMTSSQEETDLVKTYKLGVNSYIVKPVDFGKFAQVVEEVGLYWMVSNKTPD
jgi:two-component system response regulator